jgi:hypothetical protein
VRAALIHSLRPEITRSRVPRRPRRACMELVTQPACPRALSSATSRRSADASPPQLVDMLAAGMTGLDQRVSAVFRKDAAVAFDGSPLMCRSPANVVKRALDVSGGRRADRAKHTEPCQKGLLPDERRRGALPHTCPPIWGVPMPLGSVTGSLVLLRPWLRRTNVWRRRTSPARAAERLRSGSAHERRQFADLGAGRRICATD